ncbi:GNAT family protein [Silvimonas sp.]|uniref:GNAT family N-acetyltransferase n=1 Tax=Silvimonas sp. TaxID=2650811 RepID=UPI00284CE950|nr:GNAT family protein [Silvimonas sp.]MDR3428947.1 GNAT family protein [Silvimonas sp.]
MDFPTLHTERLILRAFTQADAPALFAIHSDAQAMQWFGSDPVVDQLGADALLAFFINLPHMAAPGMRWAIERRDDARLIGSCGVFKWNKSWRSCSLGYELAHPAWGHGYMREALESVIGWALEGMQLNRIEALVHPRNTPSLRVLENLGFAREGQLRQGGYWLEQYHDLVQLGLLKHEFIQPQPKLTLA